MRQIFLFSFLLAFLSLNLFSQSDTLNSSFKLSGVYEFSSSASDSLQVKLNPINSTLENFQVYNPINRNFNLAMGNIGLPTQSLFYHDNSAVGFNFGRNSLQIYNWNRDQIGYLNTKSPYTSIQIVKGVQSEQIFNVVHSQNINPFFNVTAKYSNLSSLGFYKNQQSKHTNVILNTNYISLFGRYQLLSSYCRNSVNYAENGGLKPIENSDNSITSFYSIPVNLEKSSSIFKENQFSIKQHFRFSKNLDTVSLLNLNDTIAFGHGFVTDIQYRTKYFGYKEGIASQKYYDNLYLNSSSTNDSVFIRVIEGSLGYFRKLFNGNILLKTSNQINYIFNQFENPIFQNSIGSLIYRSKLIFIDGNYVFNGYNKGDYKFYSKLYLFNQSHLNFAVDGGIQVRKPDYFLTRYISNHFIWNNQFSSIKRTFLSSELSYKTLILKTAFNRINRFVYINESSDVIQENSFFDLFSIQASNKFSLKRFRFYTSLIAQKSTNEDVYRIPVFCINQSIYLDYLKSRIKIPFQFGIDVYYFSGFYANSYVAALNSFKLQNDKIVGNYPFVDFFINFQIKPVRLFLKYEHLNSGLLGNTFYLGKDYLAAPRAFKFGFNWLFND